MPTRRSRKPVRNSVPSAAPAPAAGGPRSLARILGVFETVANAGDGLTLANLSVALGAPKSSLLMLLRPLAGSDFLVHEGGRYKLGAAAFRLAATIQAARSLPRLMRPFLQRLVAASGETAYLTIMAPDDNVVEYVDGVESPNPVRYWAPIGARRLLYTGAAGKLMLAHQPRDWQERYLRSASLKAVASNTIGSKPALRQELENIRKNGYSVSRNEAIEDAAGLAAPVFSGQGELVAGLLIGAPVERFDRELPRYKRIILEVAAEAGRALP